MKKLLFIATLALINLVNYCQEFSCIGPDGNNLCAGLGIESINGVVMDLNWCKSQLRYAFTEQFVGEIYGSTIIDSGASRLFLAATDMFESKTFQEHFSNARIDKAMKILTCIENFIKKYSRGDKTLTEPAFTIFNDFNRLIYNTRLAYTTVFSKPGPVDLKTSNELNKLIQSFGLMQKQTKTLREKLQKVTYHDADKELTKQFILELAMIVENIAEQTLNAAGNMVKKRSKDFQLSTAKTADQPNTPMAHRPSLL